MQFGAVLLGTPAHHGRFPTPKQRTLFAIGERLLIPTTASQCTRQTFEPDSENGLWKPVSLMSEIRVLLKATSNYKQVGQLSDAAIVILRQKVRMFRPSLIVDLS